MRLWHSFESLHWEPVRVKFTYRQTVTVWAGAPRDFPALPSPGCSSLCRGAVGPEGQSVASDCREGNGLGEARGALLPSGSICQSAAEPSLVLERSLGELGLVRVWEIILGLCNLVWSQEVKSLAFSALPLHGNGFDNEASFRSFLLAPASYYASWLDNYSCLSGCSKLGHWTDLS